MTVADQPDKEPREQSVVLICPSEKKKKISFKSLKLNDYLVSA